MAGYEKERAAAIFFTGSLAQRTSCSVSVSIMPVINPNLTAGDNDFERAAGKTLLAAALKSRRQQREYMFHSAGRLQQPLP